MYGEIKQTSKQIRTKKIIVQALAELLEDYPFDRITIKMICKEAGVHHRTFYRYFADKYDVLQQILQGFCAKLDIDLDEHTQFTSIIAKYVIQKWNLIKNITTANRNNGVYFDLIVMISHVISTNAHKSGAVSDHLFQIVVNSPHPDYAAYSFAGMIVGTLIKWGKEGNQVDQHELESLLDDTLKDFARLNALDSK